jgi:hypothetical protein
MTPRPDMHREMRAIPLDDATVDRLFSGVIEPDEAPSGYAEVASLFKAASSAPSRLEMAREAETVAAMAELARSNLAGTPAIREGRRLMGRFSKVKVAMLAVGSLLALMTGLAFAGALPDAAQDGVAKVLEQAGITIPNGDADEPETSQGPDAESESTDVQEVIENTEPGVERGAEVSEEASDGKSNVPESVPPTQTPSAGPDAGDESSERRNENAEVGGGTGSGQDRRP